MSQRFVLMRALVLSVTVTAAAAKAQAQGGPCSRSEQVGSSVEVMWRGTWYPAVIDSCRSGQYVIRYTSDNSKETVDASRVRSAPSAAVSPQRQAAASRPGTVRPGRYSCSAFIGVPPHGHMQPMPGFTISGSSYTHDTGGSRGTFTFDAAQSIILFHGGNLDGQAAKYSINDGGRAYAGILNERRSRAVIDCDGQ